jgi:hypothetical protein
MQCLKTTPTHLSLATNASLRTSTACERVCVCVWVFDCVWVCICASPLLRSNHPTTSYGCTFFTRTDERANSKTSWVITHNHSHALFLPLSHSLFHSHAFFFHCQMRIQVPLGFSYCLRVCVIGSRERSTLHLVFLTLTLSHLRGRKIFIGRRNTCPEFPSIRRIIFSENCLEFNDKI